MAASAGGPGRRRGIAFHRERQELPLRAPAERAAEPRVEKSNDGAEDPVGSGRVAAVQAEHPARRQADHDRPVGVGEHPVDVAEAELLQSLCQEVIHLRPLLFSARDGDGHAGCLRAGE